MTGPGSHLSNKHCDEYIRRIIKWLKYHINRREKHLISLYIYNDYIIRHIIKHVTLLATIYMQIRVMKVEPTH